MRVNEKYGQVAACFSGIMVRFIYTYMYMYNRIDRVQKCDLIYGQ